MTVLWVDKYPEFNIESVGYDDLGNKVLNFLNSSGIKVSYVFLVEDTTAHNHCYKTNNGQLLLISSDFGFSMVKICRG